MSHEEALKATLREAAKIILEELDHFLIRRRRDLYTAALRALRHGASWSELRDELGVNDKVLRDVLLNLRGAGLIARKDGLYVIDDPIVRMAVTKLRSPRRQPLIAEDPSRYGARVKRFLIRPVSGRDSGWNAEVLPLGLSSSHHAASKWRRPPRTGAMGPWPSLDKAAAS